MNGVVGSFYLDTGGKNAVVMKEFSLALGLSSTKQMKRLGVSSERLVSRIEGIVLKLGNILEIIPVDVDEKGTACTLANGKLGTDLLHKYVLWFNKERTEIIIEKFHK